MSGPDGFNRLAARAGIGPEYIDAWGARRSISTATRRALLAAMGLPARNDAEVLTSLGRLLARERHLVAPVSIVRCGEPVAVVLPEPPPDLPLHWRVQTEAGAEITGEVAAASLPVDERFTIEDTPCTRRALACTAALPWGYHHLRARLAGDEATSALIVVPERAWQPRPLRDGGRRWGLSVQLYALRSARNWGIGDFTDLGALVAGAARLGAAAVGINPLHALFPGQPEDASPYSPSSRLFLNPLYLDVEVIAEFADCASARQRVASADFRSRLSAARAGGRVDYSAVSALKWPILNLLHGHFRARARAGLSRHRLRRFQAFQRARGRALRRFAAYNVLAEAFRTPNWRTWPPEYREPDSPAVDTFITRNEQRVELHEYVQWQAHRQLQAAADAGQGMEIGMYADLAVGASAHGAESWDAQHTLACSASIGAPPDALNFHGQNWGLPPPIPAALRERRYAPFVELLRANMAHAGALRIDHVLGLMRLYWIPGDAEPKDGAYVGYPFRDLVGLIALESHRNRCLVVGEDLGTVPPGLRETLNAAGILSYRLLPFEKDAAGFRPPRAYPADALVSAGTHDMPTLPAFWAGEDIDLRTRLGLWPSSGARRAEAEARHRDLSELSAALHEQGLLAHAQVPDSAPVEAVYRYLARTPCKLLMVRCEDVLGQHEQVNVPGTVGEHPNWRQRLPVALEHAFAAPPLARLAAALDESRGREAGGAANA